MATTPSYYDGPCLAGEALTANVFVGIDASATPDNMKMLDAGTANPRAYVTTLPIASGAVLEGVVADGIVKIKLASGQSAAANALLTATTDGEATAATTGDYVYAIASEPGSGTAGYVLAEIVVNPIVLA